MITFVGLCPGRLQETFETAPLTSNAGQLWGIGLNGGLRIFDQIKELSDSMEEGGQNSPPSSRR